MRHIRSSSAHNDPRVDTAQMPIIGSMDQPHDNHMMEKQHGNRTSHPQPGTLAGDAQMQHLAKGASHQAHSVFPFPSRGDRQAPSVLSGPGAPGAKDQAAVHLLSPGGCRSKMRAGLFLTGSHHRRQDHNLYRGLSGYRSGCS